MCQPSSFYQNDLHHFLCRFPLRYELHATSMMACLWRSRSTSLSAAWVPSDLVIRASLLLLFNFLFYKPLCLGYTKIATDETSHSVPASPKASSVQQYVFFASIVPVPHHNVSPLSVPLLKDQNKD
jgi:hypothetical protein